MSRRYYHPQAETGQRVLLTGDEGHHLGTVMRARVGDTVTLFDGRGREWTARVIGLRKGAVELEVLAEQALTRELVWPVTLAVALPKGERQKWLVEKATELGVHRLVPLQTAWGVAQPTAGAVARLRRVVIEACKQCGRNTLLVVEEARPCAEWFLAAAGGGTCYLADPEGEPLVEAARHVAGPVLVAVGPEGGLTEAERQAALRAGWRPVSLGNRTLRVETAALALAAYFSLLQDSRPADAGAGRPP